VSTFSGRDRGLAALSPDLIPVGRGTDAAVRGMVAAVTVIAAMSAHPGRAAREDFRHAVEVARAHPDSVYSKAFADEAWLAIDELRAAAAGEG
jgi:hypothetical protein